MIQIWLVWFSQFLRPNIKETSLSDHSGAILPVTFWLPDFQCWGWGLFAGRVASVIWWLPGWTPCTLHSHTDQVSLPMQPQVSIAEPQMPGSIKPFVHSAAAQRQLGLVPWGRDPEQRNLMAFYTLTVCVGRSHSSSWVFSSCCCLWISCSLASPSSQALCYAKGKQVMASCLGLG